MVRWEPNARGRLEEAALELYAEHGFDRTTVADIAERAGLTERTFFRYFADKREVLFSGQDELTDGLVKAVVQAPDSASPLQAVGAGLIALAPLFEQRRERARQRQAVIDANPSLQERELSKLASLSTALTGALVTRGVGATTARLAAESGVTIFKVAFERWISDTDAPDLAQVIRELLAELTTLTSS